MKVKHILLTAAMVVALNPGNAVYAKSSASVYVITHMKAYILIAKAIMDEAAHDVFTGMILHPVKAVFPVKNAVDFASLFYRGTAHKNHIISTLSCIQNFSSHTGFDI